ncbi:MAG: biotin carboxylase N-terminal domain-containing protein, partial [Janthinobacterium lividum]
MFKKVLIANRGAIACRIERTLRRMDIRSVAVYSEADRSSLHVLEADEAVLLGPAPAAQSYLSFEKILDACAETGAEAVHPGYGFLSENVDFARACAARGITFIGPTPENIEAFALKHTARETARRCGVPMLPGTGLLATREDALNQAEQLGYPVMLKSSGGGGGIGMRVCRSADELGEAYESVLRLSKANFGDSGVYLEKFVERARHIEVQIFGDGQGEVIALGERDCSAQRRNQKVLEETPAPGLTEDVRQELFASAILLGKAVNYASAGTVEFIYDDDTSRFYFLEVNTRLQV